jgi:hypothetical protein
VISGELDFFIILRISIVIVINKGKQCTSREEK